MNSSRRPILFFLFFVSGFCGLVYQVVWTRLAFAAFGIITPVLSVVISVFMLGLALGSWAGGRWVELVARRKLFPAIVLYAAVEALTGLGAFLVPRLFNAGERLLLGAEQTDSFTYLLISAVVLAAAILPWCFLMGTTYPLMMSYVREKEGRSPESFSYLYLANVGGAMAGAVVSAVVLVELFGLRDTLRVTACGNLLIALASLWLYHDQKNALAKGDAATAPSNQPVAPEPVTANEPQRPDRVLPWLLFATGCSSMAMEVVWTRYFAPVLKTQVYSFAMVVAAYLGATFIGSWLYRRDLARGRRKNRPALVAFLCAAALLPVLANDPRLVRTVWWEGVPHLHSTLLVLASICPFCGLLGYLTPALIDEHSAGSPARAGKAYALNVLGCILGPLLAAYILLPFLSERWSLVVLALPLFGFFIVWRRTLSPSRLAGLAAPAIAVLLGALLLARTFEETILGLNPNAIVRRDYAASVVSAGTGMRKVLLVNGMGMTKLTVITKFMTHLPLLMQPEPPRSALIICFGMGTSFRSALSWGVDTTVVELVPSVRDAFGYYYPDAEEALKNPHARIVIDDGRRFLARTRDQYDVIVIDPPPPFQSAGSSLLYSRQFYQTAKRRMKPGAILQAWAPTDDRGLQAAVLRPICQEFPHVRCFGSVEGWGLHVLASMRPIEPARAEELAGRMPERAKRDLLEWAGPDAQVAGGIQAVLGREYSAEAILQQNPGIEITDDEPYNEYFLLRHLGAL